MRVPLVLAAMMLAGCAAPTFTTEATTPDIALAGAAPMAVLTDCTAHNAFLQTTQERLRPFVPANWTFTTMQAPLAFLRMFHVACDDGRMLLVISTPMFPDAASVEHHDNPDVVIDVFTTEPDALAHWNATGAQASLAEFSTAPFPGGESLIVQADGKLVLGLDVLPESPRAHGTYEWRAVYAAGAKEIGWFWGDEIADDSTPLQFAAHLGPGTRVDAGDAQPAAMGSRWARVDLHYEHGLPPAEDAT